MNLSAEQAEKLAALKRLIEEGLADEEAGRATPWDFKEFLKQAHERSNRSK
jgi:DNA-binding GntR family transcriptional regulator